MSWKNNYVVVDTETTGTGPDARIIEIAFIHFIYGQESAHQSTLIDPGNIVFDSNVRQALEINQIDPQDLRGKPTFVDMSSTVLDWVSRGEALVAHNFEFDWRMLKQEFARLPEGHELRDRLVQPVYADTLLADFGLNPGKRKRRLDMCCERWQIERKPSHRAVDDARACGELLAKMRELLPDDTQQLCLKMELWAKAWRKMFEQRRAGP